MAFPVVTVSIIGCAFAAYPSTERYGCLDSVIDYITLFRYIDVNPGSSRAASQQLESPSSAAESSDHRTSLSTWWARE